MDTIVNYSSVPNILLSALIAPVVLIMLGSTAMRDPFRSTPLLGAMAHLIQPPSPGLRATLIFLEFIGI